jgi:hypothetical protein
MKREAEKDGGAYAPRALVDALGITYQKKRERPIASGQGGRCWRQSFLFPGRRFAPYGSVVEVED